MLFLRKMVEKLRRQYHEPGSKLHKVWPVFEAFETFLFSPGHRAGKTGVHVRDYADLKRVMNTVIIALLPCLLWAIYNNGAQHFAGFAGLVAAGKTTIGAYVPGWLQAWLPPHLSAEHLARPGIFDCAVFGLQRMLPILVVSYGVGLGIEMMFSVIRKEEVSEGYLVSGILIALIVPASTPLWQLACGVAFAVVIAKEVFGGTGMNVFNPAMVCRAFLFFAFPAQMSGDSVWVAGNNAWHLLDGFSAPTPLAICKPNTVLDASAALAQHHGFVDLFFGNIAGSAGETSKFCVLLGAFWLLFTGVASWRTMAGGVIGLVGAAYLLRLSLPANYGGQVTLQPYEHLVVGGFLFGIVFMATDPVSAPETNRAKWIYGAAIGVFTMLVRTINPAYPEGTMLSILLLNAFAPTIDYFVVSKNIKRRLARQ